MILSGYHSYRTNADREREREKEFKSQPISDTVNQPDNLPRELHALNLVLSDIAGLGE